jgi:hypothetical protein
MSSDSAPAVSDPVPTTDVIKVVDQVINDVNAVKDVINANKDININDVVNKLRNIPLENINKYLALVPNPDVKTVITIILSDAETIESLVTTFHAVMADGKVDLNDAPLLLQMVRKVLALKTDCQTVLSKLKPVDVIQVIQYVFILLIKEEVVKTSDPDKLLADLNTLFASLTFAEQALAKLCGSCKCAPLKSCKK